MRCWTITKRLMYKDFAAFVLSNRRPDRVYTVTSLRKAGYTGPIFIVLDNEDPTIEEYRARYGEQVLVFDKEAVGKTFDLADTFYAKKGVVVFARNAVAALAKQHDVSRWIQLDDDYTDFVYKFDGEGHYRERKIRSLDRVFAALMQFQQTTPAVTICMAQNGDFLGGAKSRYGQAVLLLRKAMNTFVCSEDKPFQFVGRINEDVNTYVTAGMRGTLLCSINTVAIIQKQTQSNKGGMTETYLAAGTYLKSFYTVMMAPSCVKIGMMGQNHRRIHHRIAWRYAVPKIIDQRHRKP
jgi:hypothetical protein